jgi:hypothetical protein
MAAASLGMNLTAIAQISGVTLPHLRGCLLGERRPSASTAEAIKTAFGPTWPFVVGQVDALRCSGE